MTHKMTPAMAAPDLLQPVSPEWLTRGEWLSGAAGEYADAYCVQRYQSAVTNLSELLDGDPVERFEVAEARCYIASAGTTEFHNDRQRTALHQYQLSLALLRNNLKHKLNNGFLLGFGARGAADGPMTWIPPAAWFHLRIDPAEGNVVRGEGMAYWHVRVVPLNGMGPESKPEMPRPPRGVAPPKPGPRPTKKAAVERAMREKIRAGEMTLQDLLGLKKKSLPARFAEIGAGETACYEARRAVRNSLLDRD